MRKSDCEMRIERQRDSHHSAIRIPHSAIKKPPGASSHAGRKPQENHPTYPLAAFPTRPRGNCYAVSSDARRAPQSCSKKAVSTQPSAFSLNPFATFAPSLRSLRLREIYLTAKVAKDFAGGRKETLAES